MDEGGPSDAEKGLTREDLGINEPQRKRPGGPLQHREMAKRPGGPLRQREPQVELIRRRPGGELQAKPKVIEGVTYDPLHPPKQFLNPDGSISYIGGKKIGEVK